MNNDDVASRFAVKIVPAAFVFGMLMAGAVAVAAESSVTVRSPEMLALQGRWVRTDAPYVIELSHGQDGGLQAAYFNPKPIHVGKTWKPRSRVVWSRF